jgi:hypothetical protein
MRAEHDVYNGERTIIIILYIERCHVSSALIPMIISSFEDHLQIKFSRMKRKILTTRAK